MELDTNHEIALQHHSYKFEAGQLVRHIKSGRIYSVQRLCRIESNNSAAYAYIEHPIKISSVLWVRPATDMESRFEAIS